MQWHFGSGTLVPLVGFDSNNNQILAFSGTKVPLPIKVRNISYIILMTSCRDREALTPLSGARVLSDLAWF